MRSPIALPRLVTFWHSRDWIVRAVRGNAPWWGACVTRAATMTEWRAGAGRWRVVVVRRNPNAPPPTDTQRRLRALLARLPGSSHG